jgi:endogenous inhibitor of DNA gyrase (YacG/DUF329 family)
MSDETGDRPTGRPCAICGKPAIERHRPFCSRRCADVDLHRWLGGHYVIPTTEAPEDEEDGAPGSDRD